MPQSRRTLLESSRDLAVNQRLKPVPANHFSSQAVGLTAIKTATIPIEARIGCRVNLSAVHTAPILFDARCTHIYFLSFVP
jgi:hypothetical protein